MSCGVEAIARAGGIAEVADRVRGRLELRANRRHPAPALEATPHWDTRLHELVGAPDCSCPDFDEAWAQTVSALERSPHPPGKGYDAGVTLARASFIVARHLKPDRVVETGVARGVTSRIILDALHRNGAGKLVSIDLPPVNSAWVDESRMAVTADLADRWTFIRGSTRRKLPAVLGGQLLRMFVHDSLHTYPTMMFEFQSVWPLLEPGGVLLADDIEDCAAFSDFAATVDAHVIVVQEEHRSGYVGGLVKR